VEKPIYFSAHAKLRMLRRGAEEYEVIYAIRSVQWEPAKRGKFHAYAQFDFGKLSPID